MSEVKIRFIEQKDLKDMSILLTSFENYFCDLDNVKKKYFYISENNLNDIHFSDNKFLRTLIAEKDDKMIGIISFYKGILFEDNPYYVFHLPQMFVVSEFRNTNVIQKLLLSVRTIAIKEKISKLVFSVYGLNKSVQKHYEGLGANYFANDNEHFMYFDIKTK